MKIFITIATCMLMLRVESQVYLGQNQYNDLYTGRNTGLNSANQPLYAPSDSFQFAPITQTEKLPDTSRDSYLQAISRNDNTPNLQFPNHKEVNNDERIYFTRPSEELSPPSASENANQNYYSTQQNNEALPPANVPQKLEDIIQTGDQPGLRVLTVAVTDFGLRLIKIASQFKEGNVIMSPMSIATVVALLQQGATGLAQEQIKAALNMSPDFSKTVFSIIAANVNKRNSPNVLTIANNMYVSNDFNLNNAYKSLAIHNFWSDVSPTNFAQPAKAIQAINAWVATKTNNKITNLLAPGAVSPATQLILVNAVYFKGVWKTKFNPEYTQPDTFHLSNGEKKNVPFMHIREAFQVGHDLNTRALVTILPFEGNQYSLILILPKKTDNVANVLSTLSAEQLLYYQTFSKIEIAVNIPKFTLKTDTDLKPILRNMNVTSIFGPKSELTGIGLYHNTGPQISNAVHSGFLSVDEQGVTAAAATAFVAVALSYDDSSITFRADRPFIAVLWDNELSMPIFIGKIEDPS